MTWAQSQDLGLHSGLSHRETSCRQACSPHLTVKLSLGHSERWPVALVNKFGGTDTAEHKTTGKSIRTSLQYAIHSSDTNSHSACINF